MKIGMLFILLYPLSNSAMELARAQDQAARLVAQHELQNNLRLQASETQRLALAAAVHRDQEKIAQLEAELNALRAANNLVPVAAKEGKVYFSSAQWDKIERGAALTAAGCVGFMVGYWCGVKNNVAPNEGEKDK